MKQVTPYGRFVRIRRMELGHLLVEQALFMDCTPSLLSSVELGRKPVPESWFSIVAEFLGLDDDGKSKLRTAIDRTNVEFRTRPRSANPVHALAASKK